MEKVIDGSGAVDQAKMHACNVNNIIDKLPSKAVCPTPGFFLDQFCKEKKSMANFRLASVYVRPRFALGQYVPRLI